MKTTPKLFTVRDWTARMTLLGRRRQGRTVHRLRRASVSGTTWPTEQIAIAERPHVIHNITYKG